MNQEKLFELIKIVSSFYIVPKIQELYNFYPELLPFSEYEKELKIYSSAGQIRITADFVCLNIDQSIEELIAKRKTTEKRIRIISKYLRHQKLEKLGIQGLFVSIHNFEPILIIITRNENIDYIRKQMPKYLKSYKDIKVKIICGPNDIKLNLNEAIFIINSEPIFSLSIGKFGRFSPRL